jgi:hypothetical protein
MTIRDENGFELVSHDEKLGRTVWKYFDGEKTVYRTDYRTDQIVADNKAHLLDSAGQKWGGGRRVASIPLNIYFEQLAEAQNQKDEKYMSKWLNDSDNAAFRCFGGRV